ncbi:malate synthase A [Fulvivirga kasyanovii]|uniref:Malate synthase n=1 Tax=Fulvivirga kasyanovii TaxID=396812 RepID=A0ABW9RMC6_9BACT|nr:malate synthase A [Fulvivirga kasyanovii]MTI25168.1 malate synthase A [Fulvivirga kasyanovii]
MIEELTTKAYSPPETMHLNAGFEEAYAEILTPEALKFLFTLHEKFNGRRKLLLQKRVERQKEIDNGVMPDFLESTKAIREGDWQVARLPKDLLDRRVEITGPVERKMIINALNSGAKVFMADFEDSNTPSWKNNIEGQINLRDAVNRTIEYKHPKTGKAYTLNSEVATLFVRPRGWHLEDKHITIKGEPISGSLMDFGLYFFHNAKTLINNGSGPYFYLPKLESHLEARLWNDVFVYAQDYLGIPQKTIKATVLIETILASFELHEILFELKDHSAGLNCGRWDYIFSFIKKFRNKAGFVMPDRSQITMGVPFMKAYTLAVIKACHKRCVHAMGGMAAQVPIKEDPEANEAALDKVRADKVNEVRNGHDGTWVAHPGLVKVAENAFNEYMPTLNQIHVKRSDVMITAEQLLEVPKGTITENGLRTNINVGILYIESWLRGNGAAAIYHLMEDAATAEISRTQVWQWLKNGATLDDGRVITEDMYEQLKAEELEKIKAYVGEENYKNGRFDQAISIFDKLVKSDDFKEFLTIPAYQLID